MGAHRDVRPRWGRLTAATSSLVVTATAVFAGLGLLPSTADDASPGLARTVAVAPPEARPTPTSLTAGRPGRRDRVGDVTDDVQDDVQDDEVAGLPARSGAGRRVVFSESEQRVWLVDDAGEVAGTWLVSGSVLDNLQPGTYEVWSRSRHAIGIDDSGVMEFFVRFTRGPSGAAIGFHSIPTKDGVALQTRAELGTPTSHGCIRQRRAHARRMWDYAGLGTTVVVTA